MDAYQRLTEDLPARIPPGRSQRASEKATREAVAGLPLANPAQALQEVGQVLDGMLAVTWNGGERIAALAHLRAPVESLCRGIEQQLGTDSHPLPAASAERAATAQRLEWQLACGYAIGLQELCAPAGKLPMFKGKVAAAAAVAGLVHASRALIWAYRQYRTPPAGVWGLVHALYAFAGELGLADQLVEDAFAESGPLSARSAYAQTLLLAISNPYRFSARELKDACAVIRCVGGQCGLARDGTQGVSIDTGADAGPGYVAEEQLAAGTGVLALDVNPVERIFDERIALLPKGVGVLDLPRPGGGVLTVQVALLRRLQASWAHAMRGHTRLPAAHVLDLMVGMHALHYALAGNLDFATFIRQVHGEAITVGRHELASAWLASSDTARPQMLRGEVLDQSEGGYRMRLQAPDGARLRIGEVIGLAPASDDEDEREWMVGIIRWLRLEGDRQLLGAELLHRTARAAGVRPVTAGGEALVPQRAVELPGYAAEDGLAVLVTNHFPGNATTAEVVLPALASDWKASAVVGVWRCDDAEVLGSACVRVNLVRGRPAQVGETEGAE
jgi:hypothetical protein